MIKRQSPGAAETYGELPVNEKKENRPSGPWQPLGGLQRVYLGLGGTFRFDVGGEVATSAHPFARGHGVAATELLFIKIPHTVTTCTLFHNGLQQNSVEFHAGFSLDGTGQHLVRRTHENPPSSPGNGLFIAYENQNSCPVFFVLSSLKT